MKYKKYFKIKYSANINKQYDKLNGGEIGLKSTSRVNITFEQIASAMKSLKRIIKKKNFLLVNAAPFWMLTRKPRDVRMGRGKGTPAIKIFPLRAGKILLELKNVNKALAIKALNASCIKLPGIYKIVNKNDKSTNSIKNCW